MEHLKKAQENLSKGVPLDTDLVEEVERAKKELMEVLKSANLEIVGVTKRKVATPPPELKEKVSNLNKEIYREIGKVINQDGLSSKIEELKDGIERGLSPKHKKKIGSRAKEKDSCCFG
ncbi:hypothetical protein TorRG33x02_121120 [Trema orientale]|uniref:Uncharacterized protein n=1 Tax=Trema orientale TaxID=63057 RepID=A0A2P5F2M5_TREOI|nr:hypothetical protein TorRG33x02_121120 [Trema orientale]